MRVMVNGVRLFFDVEGASLVPDGPSMREKPTLLLLHGGPGFDHSIYKPGYASLADCAQLIYLDHRGNGRSDSGPKAAWTLAQWGDDVHAFCEVLGIKHPVVLGASFGGKVAMAYATRHPAHPAKLILISTEAVGGTHKERRVAMFEKLGGPEVGALARHRIFERPLTPGCASHFRSTPARHAIRMSLAELLAMQRYCSGSLGQVGKTTAST
jgi:pimeloyl-ACP methyl ester carboxylesterase